MSILTFGTEAILRRILEISASPINSCPTDARHMRAIRMTRNINRQVMLYFELCAPDITRALDLCVRTINAEKSLNGRNGRKSQDRK